MNNSIGVSVRGLPRSDKSGKTSCESVTSVHATKRYKNVKILALL